jgi:uncharacterized protein YdbL (DUF1318 family)
MKNLFFFLAISLSSLSAMACMNPEAQFTGVISEVQKYEYNHFLDRCFYKIKFIDYKASDVCGLDEAVSAEAEFYDQTCALTVGTQVSGYLVIKDGVVVID